MTNQPGSKVARTFYEKSTLEVARQVIGKIIVYKSLRKTLKARIVEVEAYIGKDDPACHAARGMTKRNEIMFGKPGMAYIYLIYGIYHCLNFVTEVNNFPAAVLLRAAEPIEGIDQMNLNSPNKTTDRLLAGPGLFCKAFGLTLKQNGLDLIGERLYLEHGKNEDVEINSSARVGISVGVDLPWRFYDKNSDAISKFKVKTI